MRASATAAQRRLASRDGHPASPFRPPPRALAAGRRDRARALASGAIAARLTWLLETVWAMVAIWRWSHGSGIASPTRLLCWLLFLHRAGAGPRRRAYLRANPRWGSGCRTCWHRAQSRGTGWGAGWGFVPAILARELLLRLTRRAAAVAGVPGAGGLPEFQRVLRTDQMVGGAGLRRGCRCLPRHPGRPWDTAVGHVPVPVRRGDIAAPCCRAGTTASWARRCWPANSSFAGAAERQHLQAAGFFPGVALPQHRHLARGIGFVACRAPRAACSRASSSSISQLYLRRGGAGSLRRNRKAASTPASAPPRCDSRTPRPRAGGWSSASRRRTRTRACRRRRRAVAAQQAEHEHQEHQPMGDAAGAEVVEPGWPSSQAPSPEPSHSSGRGAHRDLGRRSAPACPASTRPSCWPAGVPPSRAAAVRGQQAQQTRPPSPG